MQSRERGALFVNAAFRLPDQPTQPVFDWVTFDTLQNTMDKTLQESVAFYDPGQIVLVFVYLPSHTGNSVAIWRRKIPVPGNVRLMLQKELGIVKKGLRPAKDYVLFVEEWVLLKFWVAELMINHAISSEYLSKNRLPSRSGRPKLQLKTGRQVLQTRRENS